MDSVLCHDNICYCRIECGLQCIIGCHVSRRAHGSHFRFLKKGYDDIDHLMSPYFEPTKPHLSETSHAPRVPLCILPLIYSWPYSLPNLLLHCCVVAQLCCFESDH